MTCNRGRFNLSGWALAGVLVSILLLGACGGKSSPAATSASGNAGPDMAPIVSGIALPAGYKIDANRTLVLGADDRWTGRVAYTSSTSADDVFDFLRREMPNFGWSETAAMRSDVSLLTFMSETTDRVATIHIERGGSMFGGATRVDMVVSPRVAPPTAKTMPTAPRPVNR